MDPIDQIIVVLGPAAANSSRYAWPAADKENPDTQITHLPGIVEKMLERKPGDSSILDQIFSQVLTEPVQVRNATATWWQKDEDRYPAIHFLPDDIVGPGNESVQEDIDRILRELTSREELSEKLGRHLEIDWARMFVTFG